MLQFIIVKVGVSNICYFHPDPWGNDPIWRAYFSDGLVQPPTSCGLYLPTSSAHCSSIIPRWSSTPVVELKKRLKLIPCDKRVSCRQKIGNQSKQHGFDTNLGLSCTGLIELPTWGNKQCKSMVILTDFRYNSALFGLVSYWPLKQKSNCKVNPLKSQAMLAPNKTFDWGGIHRGIPPPKY